MAETIAQQVITLARVDDGSGAAIKTIIRKYQLGISTEDAPSGDWVQEMPTPTEELPYIWEHVISTMTDGSEVVALNCLTGLTEIKNTADSGVINALSAQEHTTIVEEYTIDLSTEQVELSAEVEYQKGDITTAQDVADTAQSKVIELNKTVAAQNTVLEEVNSIAENAQDELEAISKMITINPDEQIINLSAGDNSINITQERVSISDINGEVLSIEDETLVNKNQYITTQFPRVNVDGNWVGEMAWVARSNGHLSLKTIKGGC